MGSVYTLDTRGVASELGVGSFREGNTAIAGGTIWSHTQVPRANSPTVALASVSCAERCRLRLVVVRYLGSYRKEGGKRIYLALSITIKSLTPRRAPLVSLGPGGDMEATRWLPIPTHREYRHRDVVCYNNHQERCRLTTSSLCPRRSLALSTEHFTFLIGGPLTCMISSSSVR